MEQTFAANRRQFLKGSVAAGLIISFNLPMSKRVAAAATTSEFAPNAFLRIAPDNTITVISKHIEFGQGPYTGIATILADELDADWSQIRVESAPADHEKYANLSFGPVQGTGGSSAMANSWGQLRNAGAEARARLIAAAAKEWNVDARRISIEKGIVRHPSGKAAAFGELVGLAQTVIIKVQPKPKDSGNWRLIGKHVPKVDTVSSAADAREMLVVLMTMWYGTRSERAPRAALAEYDGSFPAIGSSQPTAHRRHTALY